MTEINLAPVQGTEGVVTLTVRNDGEVLARVDCRWEEALEISVSRGLGFGPVSISVPPGVRAQVKRQAEPQWPLVMVIRVLGEERKER